MNCSVCGSTIEPARLTALPSTQWCLTCAESRVEPVKGAMLWSGKHAPEIEIDTRLAYEQRPGGRLGPHIRFTQREGPFGVARDMEEQKGDADILERLRREKLSLPEPDSLVEPILRNPARCHPDKPSISAKSGLCLDCALKAQKARLRR